MAATATTKRKPSAAELRRNLLNAERSKRQSEAAAAARAAKVAATDAANRSKLAEVVAPPKPAANVVTIRPQAGPQEAFLASSADIAIYGGAAFAGKTFALLLEPLRHVSNAQFRAVIFRRETPQIRNPGGLWDESMSLYPKLRSRPVQSVLEHNFPSGAQIKFAHLEHRDTVYDWDGSQIPFIGFDQLEHFDGFQFFYMLSRNRSASGVRPYIRATCNPDPDSFLAQFLAWWIDQETGLPIPERSGKTRWMMRDGDNILWFATREEARAAFADDPEADPKSVAFFPGNIFDNQIGMKNDPGYLGNLKAMQLVERERLLGGNWKVRPSAGLMFRREWCPVVEAAPADTIWVRYWDLAATEKIETNDPDWTVGVKLGYCSRLKHYFIANARRMRESAGKVREAMLNVASEDGVSTCVGVPQDPGQAGKDQAQGLIKNLDGYSASARIESGDKVVRFSPFSAQCEAGNVFLLRGISEDFLGGLESFPDGKHKDDADACSGAYAMFQEGRSMGLFDYMKQQYEAQRKPPLPEIVVDAASSLPSSTASAETVEERSSAVSAPIAVGPGGVPSGYGKPHQHPAGALMRGME